MSSRMFYNQYNQYVESVAALAIFFFEILKHLCIELFVFAIFPH